MKISATELDLRAKATRFLPAGGFGNIGIDTILRQGKNGRIWDVSGNEYVDFLLGSGPIVLGHAHPEVNAAVLEQLERGSTFFASNDKGILLAEAIVEAVPCAEQVRFLTSGTEANAYAMRLARAYCGRTKILKFEGAYHGMSDYGLMSLSPIQSGESERGTPDSAGIPPSVQGEMIICPYNDIDRAEQLIHQYKDELAAVIVEPIQRLILPNPGFLQRLREITREYNTLLIFDEVVTGFRLAYGGAQEYFGVTPDLCTLGKAIGGGHAAGAVAGPAKIMAHFDASKVSRVDHLPMVCTFGGNPIAAAAGLATLRVLKRPGTYDRIFQTGQALWNGVEKAFRDAGVPAVMCGVPPMFDAFFTERVRIQNYREFLQVDLTKGKHFNSLLRQQGVLKGDSKIYVAYAHDARDLEQSVHAFELAAQALAAGRH